MFLGCLIAEEKKGEKRRRNDLCGPSKLFPSLFFFNDHYAKCIGRCCSRRLPFACANPSPVYPCHFLPRHWIHTDPFCCRLSRPFFTVNIRKRSSSCPAPAAAASSRPVRLHAHTVGDEQECYLSIESPWRKLPAAAERSVTV